MRDEEITLQEKWDVDSNLFKILSSEDINLENESEKSLNDFVEKVLKQVIITKGGVGSGIRGHRTIRQIIDGIPEEKPKEKPVESKRNHLPEDRLAIYSKTTANGLKDALLAEDTGVDLTTAAKMRKALGAYSDGKYKEIINGKEPEASILDEFINKAPKFDGSLYRGIIVPIDFAKAYKPGETLNMKGVSSWSSKKDTAEDYSLGIMEDQNFKIGKDIAVVFVLPETNNGTSIKHVSKYQRENEVLVAASAKYKIKKIDSIEGYKPMTYVHLEEMSVKGYSQIKDDIILKKFVSGIQLTIKEKWNIDSSMATIDLIDKEKSLNDFVEKVLKQVKTRLKAMSKEDWIAAWKEDPHWDKEKSSGLVKVLLDSYGKNPESILEIGCGNGIDSVALGKTGAKVVGIDISPDAIKIAKENNNLFNVKFMVGDAEALNFKDDQFDLVYSMAVLHSTNLSKSISEVSRVLKSGGQSLLFLYQKTLHNVGEDERDFKFGEIETLFKENELAVLDKQKGTTNDKDENGDHTHYWRIYVLEK